MPQIPQKLTDYAVWIPGVSSQLGVGDVTLPSFEAMTTETSGSGIAGTLEVPTIGQFGSQTLGIAFNTISKDAISLMGSGEVKLEMMAAQQSWNTSQSKIVHEGLKIVFRGLPKNLELGTLTKNDSTGTNVEFELTYIKILIGNESILEYDKLSYKYVVNGVDLMVDLRKFLGMA